MSVKIHFDTGSLSSEEATGLSAFIAAVQPALLSTAQLLEYNRGLYPGAATVALTAPATAESKHGDFVEANVDLSTGEVQVEKTTPEAYAAKRERGKPAPGRAHHRLGWQQGRQRPVAG